MIHPINTLPNFNLQLVWSKSYFTNASIDMTNWNIIESLTKQKYDVSNSVFVANNDRFNSYASVAMKNYTKIILDAIASMSDFNQTDMVAICEGVYSNMKTDNNLDENNKLLLAVVIGVTEGSYLYWKDNVNNWPIITKPNNNTQYKWKQVAGFLAVDAMGAMDGGAAGSVLPGVGTVAGAVMGGALFSGFVAWGW